MTDEQIKALFPGCTIRRLPSEIGRMFHPDPAVEIELEHGEWTYDQIKAIADGFGTTDINFRWTEDPGYSEYTPGSPDTFTIVVNL